MLLVIARCGPITCVINFGGVTVFLLAGSCLRLLLSFFVYFGVKRLITIIIDNLYDVVVYIVVFSLVKFQVGPCVNKEEELDCRVPCLLSPHIPTVREHVDIYV